MFNVIVSNLSTILVGGLVAALLVLVAVKMIQNKKKGKSSCGCQCAGCPNAGACHPKAG